MTSAAEATLTKIESGNKQSHIKPSTVDMIKNRRALKTQGRWEEEQELIKEIRKQIRRDKREAVRKTISKDLDIRVRWTCLMKTKYRR